MNGPRLVTIEEREREERLHMNGHGAAHYRAAEPERARVRLTVGTAIKAVAIRWLWPGWLAAGKLVVFGGPAGTGKTTVVMRMAATVTTGGKWPDGTYSPVGNVVIWSGEDDPADTLIPRLAGAGADLSRVFFVTDVQDRGEERAFDPAKDMVALRDALADVPNIKLIIVDPIVSAIGGDSHKNAETRRGLAPLVSLASDIGAALLGITHFSKGSSGREPVERITGSLAFGALARVVLIASKEQDAEDGAEGRRFIARAKSNIGPDDGGFAYRLDQVAMPDHPDIMASIAVFGEAIEGTARDMLATAEANADGEGGQSAMAEAEAFLLDMLLDGAAPANKVKSAAAAAGHSWATIRRAKDRLGVTPRKGSMDGGWEWHLPEDAQRNPKMLNPESVSTFGKNEHLRDENAEVDI